MLKASGAYVFRPNGTFPIKPEGEVRNLLISCHCILSFTWELFVSKFHISLNVYISFMKCNGYISYYQVPLTVLSGPILDEVHHQLNTWLHQVLVQRKIQFCNYYFEL